MTATNALGAACILAGMGLAAWLVRRRRGDVEPDPSEGIGGAFSKSDGFGAPGASGSAGGHPGGSSMTISTRHYLEELANVAENYPLFAGDTISHATAAECARRGWIVRDAGGDWIPTAEGLRVHYGEARP